MISKKKSKYNQVELEEIVFNAIQDYLNKNRPFIRNKIISYLHNIFKNTSMNVNKNGIQKILISLAEKKKIAFGSKLTKEDILLNSNRKKIYDFIREHPGTYFNRILNELDLNNNVIVWHLSFLEKFNFIKKMKIEYHEVYFESHLDLQKIKKIHILSKEKSKKIINYLKAKIFGVTKTQITIDLKMHNNTATKYLNYLLELNSIFCRRKARKILYFLQEDYLS